MTAGIRPIGVEPDAGEWLWTCRPGLKFAEFGPELDEHHGAAETQDGAIAAGLDHLNGCKHYAAGIDRLLAGVMAVPVFRRIPLPTLEGGRTVVSICLSCEHAVDDENAHVDQHLTAAGVMTDA